VEGPDRPDSPCTRPTPPLPVSAPLRCTVVPVRCAPRIEYRGGLVIRCADQEEAEHTYAESSNVEPGVGAHCLILETGNDRDYVVAHAAGWAEDMASEREPSALAGFAPGSYQPPTFLVDRYAINERLINCAPATEFRSAECDGKYVHPMQQVR
jgi:hypothetical protein